MSKCFAGSTSSICECLYVIYLILSDNSCSLIGSFALSLTAMSAIPRTLTDLGLPPRPPTVQTPLWEHLLRPNRDKEKPPSLQNMPIIAPPLAPLDKNATSMRVLLHDTQANFEKFAKHVGQLLHEVKETHTEMKTTHSLFERDRESLVGDILDLGAWWKCCILLRGTACT